VRSGRTLTLVAVALGSVRCASEYGAFIPAVDGSDATSPNDAAPRVETDAGEEPASASDAASEADVYDECDKDKDGYRATSCGGNDCDDNDRRAHPNQDFLRDPATAPMFGNWDCMGAIEKQTAVNAGFCSSRGPLNCTTPNGGFVGDPGCGEAGTIQICTGSNPCNIVTTFTQAQGCK
jgi:hypothetical protein